MESGQKTESILKSRTGRVDFVDALRGFAIMSILLLHNIEHFDFYYFPPELPDWMKSLDRSIFSVATFLFSGKSYAIFALLFGFTFDLMDTKQAQKGRDFRGRFLWRLFLLFLFGMFNTIFYLGDILNVYALLGLAILPVCRLSDKALLWVAVVLLLQPVFMSQFVYSLFNPNYAPVEISAGKYFGLAALTQGGDSFIEMVKGNFTNGKIAVYVWSWFNGRFFQTPALFMLGMLLGRKKLFVHNPASDKFWKITFIIALVLSLLYILFGRELIGLTQGFARRSLARSMNSWYNLSMTFLWVSILYLLYKAAFFKKVLNKLTPFGRMSLSCYVMQSMLGAFVYYGFALGLYRYTGATYSLLIGIVLFLFQGWFCRMWLKTHSRGPLESLWHKLTWLNYEK